MKNNDDGGLMGKSEDLDRVLAEGGSISFRGGSLAKLKASLRAEVGEDFAAASDHNFRCRCERCLTWWAKIGPEEDRVEGPDGRGRFGPFQGYEVNAEQRRLGLEVTP